MRSGPFTVLDVVSFVILFSLAHALPLPPPSLSDRSCIAMRVCRQAEARSPPVPRNGFTPSVKSGAPNAVPPFLASESAPTVASRRGSLCLLLPAWCGEKYGARAASMAADTPRARARHCWCFLSLRFDWHQRRRRRVPACEARSFVAPSLWGSGSQGVAPRMPRFRGFDYPCMQVLRLGAVAHEEQPTRTGPPAGP